MSNMTRAKMQAAGVPDASSVVRLVSGGESKISLYFLNSSNQFRRAIRPERAQRARTHKPEEIGWKYVNNTKKAQLAAGDSAVS